MITDSHVLYEDNHLIAINKYPGQIVQGDKTGDTPLSELVARYLKKKYNKPGEAFIGVTHRIDRPVSGIVMFAKTSKGLSRINTLFRDKTIQKTYWALVEGVPDEQEKKLEALLWKNEKINKSFVVNVPKEGALKSTLSYKVVQKLERYTLLEINPDTGRHHQIRVMLASIGCPIKGDVKYGARRGNKDQSICLHARMLQFEHPVKKEMIKIVAPVPATEVWDILKK